jgi:hypothetical protein
MCTSEPDWHDRQSRREYFEQFRERDLSARLSTLKLEGSGPVSFINWCAQFLQQKISGEIASGSPSDISEQVSYLVENAEKLRSIHHAIRYDINVEQVVELQNRISECIVRIRSCFGLISKVDLQSKFALSEKENDLIQMVPSRIEYLEDILLALF